MIIRVVPPKSLKPMQKISPSRYSSLLACNLREIWTSNNQPPLLPIAPSARLGMIVHKLLQLAFSNSLHDENDMQICWDEELKDHELQMMNNPLEKHLVPISNHVNKYLVKQIMAFDIVRHFLSTNYSESAKRGKLASEMWVQTNDGKVGGRIDLVKHDDEGVVLVDYKSGTIIDPDLLGDFIKEEYEIQLKLYAALYYVSHDIWPDKLLLIGLNQIEYEIPIIRDECSSLLRTAVESLDELNRQITGGLDVTAFATPSPRTCKFCLYRPSCQQYWVNRRKQDQWPLDFEGTVKNKKIIGNGLFKIELENEGVITTIRSLSPERHYFLNSQITEVMFCNLGRDTATTYFKETLMTTGYGLS